MKKYEVVAVEGAWQMTQLLNDMDAKGYEPIWATPGPNRYTNIVFRHIG